MPNGATVATVETPDAESVAFGIFTRVGSRYETPEFAGACHFIEHMLFKGTKRRSAAAISREVEGCGGSMNAFTSEDATCFHVQVPYDCAARAVDVFLDMFLNASFNADDFERERGVILDEMRMYEDQPDELVMMKAQSALFPRHPLGDPIVGNEASLKGLTPRRLRAWRDATYAPASTVFVFSGRISHERALQLVSSRLAKWKRRPAPRFRRFAASRRPVGFTCLTREVQQVQAALGFRAFGVEDARRPVWTLVDALLAGGMSSRLFQEVREKRGLCYGIASIPQPFDEIGAHFIAGGFPPEKAIEALRTTARVIAKFRDEGPSAAELARTKRFVTGAMRLRLESTRSRMNFVGARLLKQGTCKMPEEIIAELNAVTAQQIRETAAALFPPGVPSLTLVVPKGDTRTREEWCAAAEIPAKGQSR